MYNTLETSSAPIITATHVTVGTETVPIYGGTTAGRITPAQAEAMRERGRRASSSRPYNSSGVGF
jgi:hypothetical protein